MTVTMTVRATKKAVRSGKWVLGPAKEIVAKSPLRQQQLTEAVTMARIYLTDGSMTTGAMGAIIGRTEERASQIIRLGIKYMRESGWLYPAPGPAAPHSSRSRCG